jgi:hypothetical protein
MTIEGLQFQYLITIIERKRSKVYEKISATNAHLGDYFGIVGGGLF